MPYHDIVVLGWVWDFLVLSYVYSKRPIFGLTPVGVVERGVESMTRDLPVYPLPCVGYFTSIPGPGIVP